MEVWLIDSAVQERCRPSLHKSPQEFSHLGETDSSRLLAETLTAEIEAVLANETSLMSAEAAEFIEVLHGRPGVTAWTAHH